jgi:ISXO2-like transposase domain
MSCIKTRGKKGVPHRDPEDPPRRRGNQFPGQGNGDNDRPPVCGVVGRESGQVRLRVAHRADRKTLEEVVGTTTEEGTKVNTEEGRSYDHLAALGRGHARVCHAQGEWAGDDDGDGIREVHDTTLEGIGTGLRNFLRLFRGVNKEYLCQ